MVIYDAENGTLYVPGKIGRVVVLDEEEIYQKGFQDGYRDGYEAGKEKCEN